MGDFGDVEERRQLRQSLDCKVAIVLLFVYVMQDSINTSNGAKLWNTIYLKNYNTSRSCESQLMPLSCRTLAGTFSQ